MMLLPTVEHTMIIPYMIRSDELRTKMKSEAADSVRMTMALTVINLKSSTP